MSEGKKVKIMVDPKVIAQAVLAAFQQVHGVEGLTPVVVPLGQIGDVVFELGAYDLERMEFREDQAALELTLDDPAVYEQLELKFLH